MGNAGLYMFVDYFAGVGIVEEVPVAEDGVAEYLLCFFVYGVDGEGAAGGAVADGEEGAFGEAGGVVV